MKRKIGFYINSLAKGGAERVILNLFLFFKREGYDVFLVTSRVAEEEYEFLSDVKRYVTDDIKKNTLLGRISFVFKRHMLLKKIWREEKPSSIVSFIGKMNIFAIMTARKLNVPVYVSVRSDPKEEYHSASLRFMMRRYFKYATGIVVQTEDAKRYFDKKLQDKVVVLPNAMSELFMKERFAGARDNEIVTVGRIDANKNHEMLIKAFSKICNKYPTMVLRIYGGCPEGDNTLDTLKALTKELGIDNRVFFEGRQNHIEDKIYRSRIFALTSDFEGMPNALIEAMALGLAVVSTDCPCGGPRELIKDGENGLLVPVGDYEALATAFDRILSDERFEECIGMNASNIQELVEPEKVNRMWQSLIEKRKLTFYLGSLGKGGAEHVVVNLAEYFTSLGWEVTIVTKLRADEEYEISGNIRRIIADIEDDEISKNRITNLLRRIRKLRRIFRELGPNVIVSMIGKNNFMAIRAAKKLKIPVVVSVRSAPEREYKSRSMSILVNTMFRKAAGIILQTRDAKAYFKPDVQKNAVILPNSLKPKFIRPRYDGVRDNRIVTVGRLDDNKNQIMLIKAFERIADEFPEMELALYGDGSARQKWEGYAEKSQYASRIHFMGTTDEIYIKIHKDRIFVLPSIMEGMPNALIEAMALGLAVVSTDCPCGGPRDLLGQNENGLLVPVNDVDAMADALRKILSDEKLEKQLGVNAYNKAQEMNPVAVNQMWRDYLESKMKL